MTQPPFRPQQAGGAIGGFGKRLKPTSKWTKAKQDKERKLKKIDREAFERGYDLSRKGFESPQQLKLQNIRRSGTTSGRPAPVRIKAVKRTATDQKKIKIESEIPKGTSGGSTKSPSIFGKGGLLTKTDLKFVVKPSTTKRTGVFKATEKPVTKTTSQQTRQRQKLSPTQEREVGYKTQVDQQTNPIYQNPSVAVKVKHQPDIFLTQQEVSRLSSNMYYKPTGVMLPTNKPFLVGSTVLAVGLGGQTLVQIAPSLLPKDEQEKIELLPETDELEVQKVIEQKQTLTPEEISDLSVKTKPLIEDDTERKRIQTTPIPDEQETQILTKEKQEDVNPFEEEPFEDQLEKTGLDDDLEDETNIVVEPEEAERVILDPADFGLDIELDLDLGGGMIEEQELEEEIKEEEELEEDLIEETDLLIPTPTPTPTPTDEKEPPPPPPDEQETGTPTDEKEPPPPPPDEIPPIIPAPFKEPLKRKKRKPAKRKKYIRTKDTKESPFKKAAGQRAKIVNFRTKKGFWQSDFQKGTVEKAPAGITLDTNKGLREDSMKVIRFTDKTTKFKKRGDPIKYMERKGLL